MTTRPYPDVCRIGRQPRNTAGWRSMAALAVYGRFQVLAGAPQAALPHRAPSSAASGSGNL